MSEDIAPQTMGRMLELLDHLYVAAEGDEPLGDLIKASDLFFFSQSDRRGLLDDIPASLEAFDAFRKHIDRIERAVGSKDATAETTSHVDSHLASFQVEMTSEIVTGNATAEALFGVSFPVDFNELPFTAESQNELRALLRDVRSGVFQGVRVLPFVLEHREDVLIARCTKFETFTDDENYIPVLQFTVSYVKWTKELLSFASSDYGVSDAEIEVLLELLDGASQVKAAERLGKSKETVKAQAKSILRKFGAAQMSDVHTSALAYAFLGRGSRVQDMIAPIVPHAPMSGSKMMPVGQLRSVEVWEYGAPDGLPIVFWHGLVLGPFFSPKMIERFNAENIRVICISRPGFGRSSPPVRWPDYDETVTADTVAVLDELGVDKMIFWVHQAGISFACRAAGALKGRVLGAAMNGAGVPIRPHMLSKMNRHTRVAAATVLHAPKLLEMMLRVGFRTWRISGPVPYFRQFFGKNGVEQDALKQPDIANLFELGFLHTTSQSPDGMIWDGKSAMLDWFEEYRHFDFPQHWMHGTEDQILDASFVAEFLKEQGQPPLIIMQGYGSDLLYRGFDQVFDETLAFFRGLNP
ncbi:alpha/beta fold hydrolase [Planktotalea sp.]|uniref:alpha/beta fold hydrolase n=1 Tax=Planktotalea sp. TaxID=2029877 RepID=UPI003298CCAA